MKKTKIKLYSLAVLMMGTVVSVGQSVNQYFLESLPQSNYLNPGAKRQETFHMNFPAFFMAGHTSVNATLTGFTFSDLVNDSIITPSGILPSLKDNNYINLSFQKDWINYGWIKGKNYWSINISTNFSADVNFNRDFAEVLVKGPGAEQFLGADGVNLDGTKYNVTLFQEYGIGYSRDVNEKLRLGGRLRFLSGGMNFKGALDGVKVTTSEDLTSMTVASNLSVQSASPLAYKKGEDGEEEIDMDATQANITSSLTNFNNFGVALDFGGAYQINEQISAYGSVRDFGLINWGSGKTLSNDDVSFKFEGFTADELINDGDTSAIDNLTDSIADIFKLDSTGGSYTTYLPTRFFVGGQYKFDEKWSANALYSGRVANGKLNNTVMAGFGWMPSKTFEARVSYTIKNGTYNNVGFATVLSLGAWQLYFITDNILALGALDYANNVNLTFGSNLTFGRAKYFDGKDKLSKKAPKVPATSKKSGWSSSQSDSTKLKSTITPPNTPRENVDAMENAEDKANKAKQEAKEEVKQQQDKAEDKIENSRDKADKKAQDAKKDAKEEKKAAKNEAKDAAKDAKDKAEKAEKVAEEKAQNAEKAIDAAEQKIKEAELKTKEAEAKAKAATEKAKQTATPESAPVQETVPTVETPAAPEVKPAPVAVPAIDSTAKVLTDTANVAVDSLLVKPVAKELNPVPAAPSSGTQKSTPAGGKQIDSVESVDELNKSIDIIKQKADEKAKTLPSDVK